jgi:hypothetical protein
LDFSVLKNDPEVKKTFEDELERLVQADLAMRAAAPATGAGTNPQADFECLMSHIREVGEKTLVAKRTVRRHADWFEKNRVLLRTMVRRKLDAYWRLKNSNDRDRKRHTKRYHVACVNFKKEMRRGAR